MKKPLKIINFDGTSGVGKTTQINMMCLALRRADVPVLLLNLKNNELILESTSKIKTFLEENPDGLVLCDGSVARMMVLDTITGVTKKDILEKYHEIMHQYQILDHKYGVTNLLLVMEDTEECNKRVFNRETLTGNNEEVLEDISLEKDVVRNMKFFDDTIMSKSLKFQVFDIQPDETIVDVQKDLVQYLEDNYDIDMKSLDY